MSNVPKLRFKEFADDWEFLQFDTIFERVITKNKENNLNVLTISAQQGLINQEEYFNKSVSAKDVTGYYLLNKNDFAYNKSYSNGYPLGAIKRLNRYEKGVVSTLYICFRTKKDSVDFCEQYFNSGLINHEIKKIAQEGARNHGLLNISVVEFFRDIYVNFPVLEEQEKIANFLFSIDKKIELLSKKEVLLKQYKKGVMNKIFNQEIRFKDDQGNEFPEWEEKQLGEIGKFQTSSIDKLSKEDEEEIYLINYMDVYKHKNINNKTIKDFQVVTAKQNQIESCNLLQGDILFTPSSETPDDIGHSVVIFENLNNAVFSYHLMRFRPSIKINILYSHYFCNIPSVLNQLAKFSTGSTRFTISVKSFSLIIIQLPCLEEQEKIANFLSAIDKKIELASTELNKSKEFKQSLLQQMFI